ncbi:hypothetical protein V6N11_066505 [Hibiscus sabdariffa]|uniref:Uncharacterized protein n=2 Tax=Hibiscus sabdariffa TaxID=183260 RepID=A0ABR2AD05_9ROSI
MWGSLWSFGDDALTLVNDEEQMYLTMKKAHDKGALSSLTYGCYFPRPSLPIGMVFPLSFFIVVIILINGVDMVKPLIVFSFLSLRRVKKKMDFAAHVLILFETCNEAQTPLVDSDKKARDQTSVAMALLYSLSLGQFVDVGATHEPMFNANDLVEGHPQIK